MKDRRAIFINTVSQIIVRVATLAFTLISVKILTNYLGVDGYGNLNTITAYINYFLVVADLGLFSVTVREISKNPTNEKRIISNVFYIRLVSALAASAAAILLVTSTHYRNNHDIMIGVMVACGFLFFNLMGSIGDMILQYRLKMQFSALAEFLSKIIALLALVAVVLLKGNFLWVVFASVTMSGILIFLFKWYFASRYVPIKLGYEAKLAKWIFNLAWPMGIVFIANNLYFRLDSLMLYVIKGPGAVGIYSSAYKILEVTVFFGSYFASSLKPTMSQNIKDNKNYLKKVVEQSFFIMLLISLPIAILCIVYAKDIIQFISSSQFISGGPALVVLSLTLPFLYFDVLLGEILIANDSRKTLLRISDFIVLFNFLFNLIFIPKYSFMGAAWGTLISEIVLFCVFYFNTRKIIHYKFNFPGITKLLLISISTLFFAFVISNTGLNFILGMIIDTGFFALAIHFFGIVNLRALKSLALKED